jgi:hypothetical protein
MKRTDKSLPVLLSELTFASWQTIVMRMGMMASGTCSLAEYQRMLGEKLLASQKSAMAMMLPGHSRDRAVLAPWHRAASANAKRLRRRKSR